MFSKRNILFYLLAFLNFVIIGMIVSAVSGAADGQGLAGVAIILGNGIITGAIAFLTAIILSNYLKQKNIKLIIKVLLTFFIIFLLFGIYRFLTMEQQEPTIKPIPTKVTKPV